MLVSNNKIREIAECIDVSIYDYDYIGLRVVAPYYDDYNAQIGDVLPESHEWDNGDYTDDMCNGTCAISINGVKYLRKSDTSGYIGDRVLVIGGNNIEWGNDDGEIIIRDAVVVDIINNINQ